MFFSLSHVVPWGRSFDEYLRMFDLNADSLSGNLVFEQGGQYFIMLALDGEKEFAAVLWDADDPGTNLLYRSGRMPDLPDAGWFLAIQSNSGMLELDAYHLFEFSEFVF